MNALKVTAQKKENKAVREDKRKTDLHWFKICLIIFFLKWQRISEVRWNPLNISLRKANFIFEFFLWNFYHFEAIELNDRIIRGKKKKPNPGSYINTMQKGIKARDE